MEKQTVIITGGNAGIGLASAKSLAQLGFRLILACRRPAAGEEAAIAIRGETPGAEIEVLQLDLASQDNIREASQILLDRDERIDVLLNNAGLYSATWQATADGYELQWGVNHLGHFLWTLRLMPLLQKAPAARVINVASKAYLSGKMTYDDLDQSISSYNGLRAYCRSKLANVLFTTELARRYPNIETYCLHPGVVATAIGTTSDARWYERLLWRIMSVLAFRKPDKGAQTSIFLASQPDIPAASGTFFDENQKPRSLNTVASDPEAARKHWEYSLYATNLTNQQEKQD